MISNLAMRTTAHTTLTTPMSGGRVALHRCVCYSRAAAALDAARRGCAAVVS